MCKPTIQTLMTEEAATLSPSTRQAPLPGPEGAVCDRGNANSNCGFISRETYCSPGVKGGAALFCPSDHTGIWAMQREGLRAKGKVGKPVQDILEGLAKETGTIN